jgi:hypothetical protein
MSKLSLGKLALIALPVPTIVIAGALVSIALGRGEAVMLPSTAGAVAIIGLLVAVGAAWHDLAPNTFRWIPEFNLRWVGVVVVGALALAATAWLAAVLGTPGLLWRPAITSAACLWFGIVLASAVGPNVTLPRGQSVAE